MEYIQEIKEKYYNNFQDFTESFHNDPTCSTILGIFALVSLIISVAYNILFTIVVVFPIIMIRFVKKYNISKVIHSDILNDHHIVDIVVKK